MTSIFIRTIIIYIVLSVMLKIMGKRQIGELEVSELITTLLISEIGALPISDTDIPLIPSIIPILFIASAEVIISILKNKSSLVKQVVEGEPTYIIYKGSLRQEALAENRISINEILSEMRAQGVGDISDVYYAAIEQNGVLSILKKDGAKMAHAVIINGDVIKGNLHASGYDDNWLNARLNESKIRQDDVFLMTIDDSGKVNLILKDEKNNFLASSF